MSFLKDRVRAAKRHAVLSVNKELLSVYWLIGKTIEEQKKIVDYLNNIYGNDFCELYFDIWDEFLIENKKELNGELEKA